MRNSYFKSKTCQKKTPYFTEEYFKNSKGEIDFRYQAQKKVSLTGDICHLIRAKKTLFSQKSRYQKIDIIENPVFGRMLFLDGELQLSESDEFIYHEMLSHPAMFFHPSPQQVLIIGGGDGGVAREVLKHNPKQVFLVDIDKMVIEASKKYLPFCSRALKNKRIKISIEEGSKFVEKYKSFFDVAIVDPTDPIIKKKFNLYRPEFYKVLFKSLKKEGITCLQLGNFNFNLGFVKKTKSQFQKIFPFVKIYKVFVPSFFSEWTFLLASKKINIEKPNFKVLERKFKKIKGLKYFSPEVFGACGVFPKIYKF
jgi:spermidine synthase